VPADLIEVVDRRAEWRKAASSVMPHFGENKFVALHELVFIGMAQLRWR
jgi:hypothetical protein